MFGSLGIPELVMIFIVALLLFGPRKLPEIGRTVGKALGEFRRASNDLKRTLEEEVAAEDLRAAQRDIEAAVAAPYPPEPPAGPAAVASAKAAAPPQPLETVPPDNTAPADGEPN